MMPIERPCCPRCRTRMMLVRLSSEPDYKDKRFFECRKCNLMGMVTVSDPMESRLAVGWIAARQNPVTVTRASPLMLAPY
jgi:hypothetical protein